MQRRQFFSILSKTSLLALTLNPTLQAQAKKQGADQLEVLNTQINGMYYYQIQEIATQLKVGQKIRLKAEPTNKFDTNAIEVYYHNYKLGYIPKMNNRSLFAMLKQPYRVSAYISHLDPKNMPYHGLEIKVYWSAS